MVTASDHKGEGGGIASSNSKQEKKRGGEGTEHEILLLLPRPSAQSQIATTLFFGAVSSSHIGTPHWYHTANGSRPAHPPSLIASALRSSIIVCALCWCGGGGDGALVGAGGGRRGVRLLKYPGS